MNNGGPIGILSISGTPAVGQTLNVDKSGITDPDGIAAFISYEWYSDGVLIASGSGFTSNPSATGFPVTAEFLGKTLTVRYSYTDGNGNTETAESDGLLIHAAGVIVGTNGNDQSLYGTADNDTILAAAGVDWIIGSTGNDSIDGGDGDSDVVMYGDYGGAVIINNTARQIGNVAAYRVLKAGGGQDTITGIEAFHGSQFSDTFYIGNNTYVFAEGGNDRITVGTSVLVLPGSGNDTITGGGDVRLDYQGGDGSAEQTRGITAVWNSATSGIVSNDGWGGKDRFSGVSGIAGSDFDDVIIGNSGHDHIMGNAGDDLLSGNGGADWIDGDAGNDILSGGDGNDDLIGGADDDSLSGGAGANALDGGTGNDTYFVQSDVAADDVIVDAGGDADVLQVLDTADRDAFRLVYDGNSLVHETMQGHRTVIGLDEAGAPVIEYLEWVGSPDFGTENYSNTLRIVTDLSNITGRLIAVAGTDGADTIVMPNETAQEGELWGEVYANDGDDNITLSDTIMYVTYGGDGNDTVTGFGTMSDLVTGDGGNDLLDGQGGDDTLFGGDGDDTLLGGAGNDSLVGGAANSELDDVLSGGDGDDTLEAGTGDSYLEGGAGNDEIRGGSGYDQVTYEESTDGVNVNLATGVADDGMGGTDTITGVEMLRGSYFNDSLTGDDGDNQFRALQGDDTIDGGEGTDRIRYDRDENRGATLGVTVNLAEGWATDGWGDSDTLISIEDVRASFLDDSVTGDDNNNRLEGNGGNDTLVGGDGHDELSGDDGNDQLFGGNGEDWSYYEAGDDFFDGGEGFDRAHYRAAPDAIHADLATGIVQDGGGGTDTIVNVERVTGSAFNDTLLGDDGDINSFTGGAGDDVIDGRGGWDYVWYGDSQSAVVVDLLAGTAIGEGNDTLTSIEGLGGSGFGDTLLGSDADNWFEPDYEANPYIPNGFVGGNDYIDGRGGFDTVAYWQAAGGITVNLAAGTVIDGQGNTDRLISIEGIDGSDFNDEITGSEGNDSLDGRSGDDTLADGGGDDTVLGGDGQDTLIFGSGVNWAEGGAENDLYVFRYAGDSTVSDDLGDNWLQVEKIAGVRFAGVYYDADGEMVWLGTNGSKITFTDPSHLAGFTFVPFADEFTRYDIAMSDITIGTLTDDTLYSAEIGYAEVYAAAGNDTIFVQSADASWVTGDGGDDVIHGGDGDDNVHGDLLPDNLGNDVLYGNGGADTLWGEAGDDQLYGGDGDDKIYGGDGDDLIDDGLGDDTIDGGAGVDTFSRYYEFALGFELTLGIDLELGRTYSPNFPDANPDYLSNIENIAVVADAHFILSGNAADNVLQASDGNDTLDGRAGADTLTGGLGDDTYVVDALDQIEEEFGEGTDTVQSSVTYVLADNLENLTLIGSAVINATGNAADNRLTGNSAANRLDGGTGADTLEGGGGNDTYVTDGGDTLIEGATAGTDLVLSSVSHTLAANFENLTLTGAAAIDGTGNTQNNTLVGNSAANSLSGGAGIDQLIGDAGKDVLTGGAGADTFVFNAIADSTTLATTADVITDFVRGTDKIDLRAIDAFVGTGPTNDAFIWKGTAAFNSTSKGEVRFQKFDLTGTANDYTMVFIDNDADTSVEMAIRLTGLFNLTASDFLL